MMLPFIHKRDHLQASLAATLGPGTRPIPLTFALWAVFDGVSAGQRQDAISTMQNVPTHWTRGLLVAVLAGALAASAAQGQTVLRVEDARTLAFQLVQQGNPAAAREVARELLTRDPEDVVALVALAQAEQALGNRSAAIAAGRKAWGASETGSERHASAVATAQALVLNGNGLRAQFWLRRAIETAPDASTRANATRDLRNVRASSPVTAALSFSVAPSTNINNGSKSETTDIGGLSFQLSGDAQALSGIEYRLGGAIGYRFGLSDRQTLSFGAALDTRSYSLSSSAKALAPNRTGSDYAFQELRLTAASLTRDKDSTAVTKIEAGLAQNWYAGDVLTRIASISLDRGFQITPKSTGRAILSVERQNRQDDADRSATIVTATGIWSHRLQSGAGISVQAFVRDTASDSPSIAKLSYGGRVSYGFAEPIFGQTTLQLSLGLERQDFDRPEPLFGLRDDLKTSVSALFSFNDLDYYGFAPTAEISFENNSSNQSLYDTQDFGIRLGLRSVF